MARGGTGQHVPITVPPAQRAAYGTQRVTSSDAATLREYLAVYKRETNDVLGAMLMAPLSAACLSLIAGGMRPQNAEPAYLLIGGGLVTLGLLLFSCLVPPSARLRRNPDAVEVARLFQRRRMCMLPALLLGFAPATVVALVPFIRIVLAS